MTTKKLWITYVLWTIGGFFGLHHFYLGRDRQAFAYWCTFGGGFGFGLLIDFFKIPSYVADANESAYYMSQLQKKMKTYAKPPFSIVRFAGQIFLGYVFGAVFYLAIPFEDYDFYGHSIKILTYLSPLPISLGVHTVGNIGREEGSFKSAFVSTVVSFLFSHNSLPQALFWCAVSASLGFTMKSREWRRAPQRKYGLVRRISVLSCCGLFYLTLLVMAVYFNAEIVDKNGEKIKFRYAAVNFLNSPMWEEIKESFQQLYNFYQVHGWRKLYDQVVDQLDPHGERRALKVLGLPENASKSEVVARWRVLSKEWHPDRHKDETKKKEAHEKFMEYQDAYQKLIKIRAKVQRPSSDSKNANDEL